MTDKHKFSPSPRLTKTLVICLLALLTACAEEDPKKFVQEGTALFDKGDMDGARVQFRNALQANPKLAEAYYGLALLDEKKPDLLAMRKNLQEVIVLDPNHADAQAKLGLLLGDQLDKAKAQLAIAKKLAPENINTLLLEATLTLRDGRKAEALQQVEHIVARDAGNADAVRLLTMMLASDKRYEDALVALSRGLEANANASDIGLGLLKVRLHREQKKFDDVVKDYEELLASHPDDKKLREDQIQVLTQIGKADLAEQALRNVVGKNPEDTELKIRLVNFVESRDAVRAETELKNFIAAKPSDLSLKTRLAGYYLGHKRSSDAEVLLKEIIAVDPKGKDGLTAKVRLAELVLARNDRGGAEMLADEVIAADGGNSGALVLRAGMRLSKRDIDGAISDLRIVLRDQPNSDQAMVMLGQAYALKNQPEVAESHWRKALEVNPVNMAALAPLTSALFSRNDAARAEDLISNSLKASPANPTMLELLVQARAAQKNWIGAEAAVDELKKQPQAILAAQLLKGMLAASQGRHAEAIEIYKEVLMQRPNTNEALVAMGRSCKATDRGADFIAFLKELIQQSPNDIAPYNALAMVYTDDKNWVEADKILRQALKTDVTALASYKLLANVMLQQGKGGEIPGLILKGLEASPENPGLMLELAKFYDGSKDYHAAIAAYDNLIKKYPDSEEAVNNLSYLLTEFGDTPDNIARAVTLSERFKDSPNPFFMDTYGWALFKSGNTNAAIDVFKNTVARVPANSEFRYHLGEAYFAAGDKTAARQELEKSLSPIGKQNEFAGIDRAKELLKQLAG